MATIIFITVPDVPAGNAWATASLGEASNPADLLTFGAPNFTRAGVNFVVASYNDEFQIGTKGRGTLTRPSWDTTNQVNMGAAINFQSRLRYKTLAEVPAMTNSDWQNFPNMFDVADPWAVLDGAGFVPIGG